ncbi:Hsp33 family molecular chaperone HslO, partial [Chitinimonas sp.]|uniref:Hsp33 family molecular chaperone HslO n=1 Tax=Chitinimonas sp. TaxID=1934313 RepID=UPI0035B1AFAC
MTQDTLQRFLFDAAPVRGEIVRLTDAWTQVLALRNYPAVLKKIVGELMAASALMTAMLKFEGSLVMQLHGKGRIKLLVIECESDLTMRATARWDEEGGELPDVPLGELLGNGHFVITLDPRDGGQTYQGMVGLSGNSVAAIIEHYMQTSEQLDTRLWLASDDSQACGM